MTHSKPLYQESSLESHLIRNEKDNESELYKIKGSESNEKEKIEIEQQPTEDGSKEVEKELYKKEEEDTKTNQNTNIDDKPQNFLATKKKEEKDNISQVLDEPVNNKKEVTTKINQHFINTTKTILESTTFSTTFLSTTLKSTNFSTTFLPTTHSPTTRASTTLTNGFNSTKISDIKQTPFVSSTEKVLQESLEGNIGENQFYDRIGLLPTSPSEVNGLANKEIQTDLSMKDIQIILENLLFLAANKTTSHFSNTSTYDAINTTQDSNNTLNSTNNYETDVNKNQIKINESTTKKYSSEVKSQTQLYNSANLGLKRFQRPHHSLNGTLPLDRFRYKSQKKFNTEGISPTTESTQANNPLRLKPMNIRDLLTTSKPLILDTEIVTSTSFDVKHGSSTEELRPVYVHSSTNAHPIKSKESKIKALPKVIIPVILEKDVKYIKVNRSKLNYPNVVIVNVSNMKGEYIQPELAEINEGRGIEFSEEFLRNVSNILSFIKQKNKQTNFHFSNEDSEDSHLNKNLTTKEIEFSTRDEMETSSTTEIWNTLSQMSKLNFPKYHKNLHKNNTKYSLQNSLNYDGVFSAVNSYSSEDADTDWQPKFPPVEERIPPHASSFREPKFLKFPSTLTLFVIEDKNERGAKVISVFGRSNPEMPPSTSGTNSPIHVFTVKEGQSLEDLLSEIIDAISKDSFPKSSEHEEHDKNENPSDTFKEEEIFSSTSLPAGEDSLKIIEALSKLLTDHYDNYNFVFGGGNFKPSTTLITPTNLDFIKLDTDAFESSIKNNIVNDVSPVTDNFSATSKYPSNTINHTYHKYYHDLFPVMTRPMNPIRTTTPKTVTTLVMDSSSGEKVELPHPTTSLKPLDFATSLDVSYSMLTGTKNVTFPIRNDANSLGKFVF